MLAEIARSRHLDECPVDLPIYLQLMGVMLAEIARSRHLDERPVDLSIYLQLK